MPMLWVDLATATAAAAAGRLHNAMAVASVFAAAAARGSEWSTLRPVDAPWPERTDRYHRDVAARATAQ